MNRIISILLIVGIVILANLLSNQFFARFDITENNQYTLSKATKRILSDLDEPVTVQAYFSNDLPVDVEKVHRDFQDMLVEYNTLSKGNVDYGFVDPSETPELEQEAMQAGIRPVLINVREKDQTSQQKAFMGAVLSFGDQKEIIPFISQETPMEYELTTAIKKMTAVDKPSIAFITGHGEADLQQMGQVVQALSIIFTVESLDLSAEASIPPRFKAAAMIAPKDSFPPDHFRKMDEYLALGGKLVIAANAVQGDFSTAQGTAIENNLFDWLANKGIEIEPAFVIDSRSGSVTVQQQQGFFRMNTQVQFPFFPLVQNFGDHPVVKGLEQVIFQFVSPIRFNGDSMNVFSPIIESSQKSGIQRAPTFFDVQKKWAGADFPVSNVMLGGVLEGVVEGSPEAKLVVFSDGDFPLGEPGRGINPDNANLLTNTIEWLSDDTGLSDLRTKAVLSRPIDDLEDGKRSFLKMLNFFLPIAIVLLLGVFRWQRNRSRRVRRMMENYV